MLEAKYQRCVVHFYRNVFSVVPKCRVKTVTKMLKATHAQESKRAARETAKVVVAKLRAMKLKEAAVRDRQKSHWEPARNRQSETISMTKQPRLGKYYS